jgi:hypothetical protein
VTEEARRCICQEAYLFLEQTLTSASALFTECVEGDSTKLAKTFPKGMLLVSASLAEVDDML